MVIARALSAKQYPTSASRHFYITAEFAIHINCGDLADKALAQEIILNGKCTEPYILLSNLEIQRENFGKATEMLSQAFEITKADPHVWCAIGKGLYFNLTGHLNYIQKKYQESKIAFETVFTLSTDAMKDLKLDLIYIRLGNIYMKLACNYSQVPETCITDLSVPQNVDENSARIAKSMYLKACGIHGTSQSWLGAGRACFALKEYDEAEDSFSVNFIIDSRKQM